MTNIETTSEDVRVDIVTLRVYESNILVVYSRILLPHKPEDDLVDSDILKTSLYGFVIN